MALFIGFPTLQTGSRSKRSGFDETWVVNSGSTDATNFATTSR